MKIKSPVSFFAYFFLVYILLRTAFLTLPWREGRSIAYDPAGYYLPLPAAFIYHDLNQYAFYDSIAINYNIGDAVSHTFDLPNGNKGLKYSLGMAVLYSPGFFLGHFSALNSIEYSADGYSQPYYFWLSMWALLVTALGLYFLRLVLLRYFKDIPVAITLGCLVLGTNYLVYAGINNLMSHGFLFALYAFLIYFSDNWHRRPSWGSSAGIGIVLGLLMLARPTEIIGLIIPVLWGVGRISDLSDRFRILWKERGKLILAISLVVLIGSLQLVYWKTYTGHWLYYSYGEQGFDFLKPHIWRGLFSFRKGWLIYTPLMSFAIIGIYHLYRQERGIFFPILLFTILNIYIVYSWHIWEYGGSVGSRAVVQSYAILCFPLTAFFIAIFERGKRWGQVLFAIVILLCIDLNIMMTWQSHAPGGPWHAEYMTQKYYGKILGKTVIDKDDKKFLDIDKELRRLKNKSVEVLLKHDFESGENGLAIGNTREFAFSKTHAQKLNKDEPEFKYSVDIKALNPHPSAWFRVSAKIFYTNTNTVFNEWQMARLKLKFYRREVKISEPSIRLQWLTDPWKWHHASFSWPIKDVYDEILPGDRVEVVLENPHQNASIYVDDVRLELIQKGGRKGPSD